MGHRPRPGPPRHRFCQARRQASAVPRRPHTHPAAPPLHPRRHSPPLDVRVAGALVLLFGITIGRVVGLTSDDLDHRPDGTYLPLGARPALLPPRLAQLVEQLASTPRGRSAICRGGHRTDLLFPGRIPSKPVHVYGFTGKLNKHGITIPDARNTARRALAATLPAPIIADLFDMHIETAVAWTHFTQRDWTDYLAARAGCHAERRGTGR